MFSCYWILTHYYRVIDFDGIELMNAVLSTHSRKGEIFSPAVYGIISTAVPYVYGGTALAV